MVNYEARASLNISEIERRKKKSSLRIGEKLERAGGWAADVLTKGQFSFIIGMWPRLHFRDREKLERIYASLEAQTLKTKAESFEKESPDRKQCRKNSGGAIISDPKRQNWGTR